MAGVYIQQSYGLSLHNLQGSQNCFDQLTDCYNKAGPTGHKNCGKWEQYCGAVQGGCKSGNFNGPPSITPYLPAKLPMLSDKEYQNAPGAWDGGHNSGPSSASEPATSDSSPKPYTQQSSPKQNDKGSIEYCGGSSGLICKTGMCCSSHG